MPEEEDEMVAIGHTVGAAEQAATPRRILLVQTQMENAGAQEVSRLVGAGRRAACGQPRPGSAPFARHDDRVLRRHRRADACTWS